MLIRPLALAPLLTRAGLVLAGLGCAGLASAGKAELPSQAIAAGAPAPAGVSIVGKIVEGRRYTDKNGENLLLVTVRDAKRSSELHVYHLVRSEGGAYRSLRQLNDFVRDCELDLTLDLVPGSIAITDLDGDGHAEASLAYTMSCKGDVSPDDMKLMLLTKGNKLAIRGTQQLMKQEAGKLVPLYPELPVSPPTIDPELKKSKAFLPFTLERWKKFEQVVMATE